MKSQPIYLTRLLNPVYLVWTLQLLLLVLCCQPRIVARQMLHLAWFRRIICKLTVRCQRFAALQHNGQVASKYLSGLLLDVWKNLENPRMRVCSHFCHSWMILTYQHCQPLQNLFWGQTACRQLRSRYRMQFSLIGYYHLQMLSCQYSHSILPHTMLHWVTLSQQLGLTWLGLLTQLVHLISREQGYHSSIPAWILKDGDTTSLVMRMWRSYNFWNMVFH